jgi:hypothetical protein
MKSKIIDILTLSPFQEGALFHHKHDSEDPYIVQNQINLTGKIKIDAIRHAMKVMTAKHDALRSIILSVNLDKPRLVVLREQITDVNYIDLSAYSREEREI